MKKKKENNNKKNKNTSNSKIKEDPKEEDIPKETGSFLGFLVYDKEEEKPKKKFYFGKNKEENIILQSNPKKTKSRFAELFQEIIENDKKSSLEDQKKNLNKSNNEDNNINNINNINENNNNISNENNNNINIIKQNNNIINDNNINNKNLNIINENNNIINDNNSSLNENNNIINEGNNIINENNNASKNKNNNIMENIYLNQINLEPIKEVQDDKNNINSDFFLDNKMNYTNNSININNSISQIKEEKYLSNQSSRQNLPFFNNPIKEKINRNSINSGNTGISTTYESERYSSLVSLSTNNLNKSNSLNKSERTSINEKSVQLIVDIKKIIFLEDKRTSIMIKNIPNKFTGELLLNIINQNFQYTYNIFILPTDNNKYKNYGYAFINFISSYFIPYFYSMFNGKMWSKTNSQKVCEITYSKIQGRKNLMSHYQGKIVYQNDYLKYNSEQKYIIPNQYKLLFTSAFPNVKIENFENYFVTKLPKKNK